MGFGGVGRAAWAGLLSCPTCCHPPGPGFCRPPGRCIPGVQGLGAAGTGEGDCASPLSCSCVTQQGEAILFAHLSPWRGPENPANTGAQNSFLRGLFCSWLSLRLQSWGFVVLAALGKTALNRVTNEAVLCPGLCWEPGN